MQFLFCPTCAKPLAPNPEGYQSCVCGFIHYDNPVPVVAVLIPMAHQFLVPARIPLEGIPDGGIVLVKRGRPPFAGQYCLPCGFLERHAHPKEHATVEVRQETHLEVRLEKLLCVCNPAPGEVNQMVISYLGRPVGGHLEAGDDAAEVGVFSRENLPEICFRSHRRLVAQWFSGELGALTGKDLVE